MVMDCFFYTERAEKESDNVVRALHVGCRKDHYPKDFEAWFYSGPVGPWDVRCNHCKGFVHRHEKDTSGG